MESKAKLRLGFYILALLLALFLGSRAGGMLQERQELQQQLAQQEAELLALQSFANAHQAYETDAVKQQEELQRLEQQLRQRGDAQWLLGQLRRLATAQGVRVLALSQGQAAAQPKRQLELRAEGNYLALLRWLRQVEREGIGFQRLRLARSEGSGQLLQAELLLELESAIADSKTKRQQEQ